MSHNLPRKRRPSRRRVNDVMNFHRGLVQRAFFDKDAPQPWEVDDAASSLDRSIEDCGRTGAALPNEDAHVMD